MRTIGLVVAYDGTDFHGWQKQPDRRTVQGVLEDALARVLGERVRVTGAGRTDAGCHARGQVLSWSTSQTLPARAVRAEVQRLLPRDVRVVEAHEAAPGFDARRSARARRYGFRLLDRQDLLWSRFAWWPGRAVDPARLERAVRVLEGPHDFRSFQSAGSSPTATRCEMVRIGWRRWEAGLMLDIVADHFLYRMVRNLVGAALQVMERDDPGDAMRELLRDPDRGRRGGAAPPQGLCLEQVFYPEGVWA